MVRSSTRFVPWKERRAVCADLRKVYNADDVEHAAAELDAFEAAWGERFPMIANAWRERWNEVTPFLAFPAEVRRAIYTTNAIEALHRIMRKTLKTRGATSPGASNAGGGVDDPAVGGCGSHRAKQDLPSRTRLQSHPQARRLPTRERRTTRPCRCTPGWGRVDPHSQPRSRREVQHDAGQARDFGRPQSTVTTRESGLRVPPRCTRSELERAWECRRRWRGQRVLSVPSGSHWHAATPTGRALPTRG